MSAHEAGAIVVTLCVLAVVYAFFRFTPLGLAMRAAAQNPVSSRLVGIRVGWMLALGWGLAAAIGSVAGMMAAPIVYLDPNMMCGILLYAFAGAVLGGIDNPFGAVFGGFAVGVIGESGRRVCRGPRGEALGRARDHRRACWSGGPRACSAGASWRGCDRHGRGWNGALAAIVTRARRRSLRALLSRSVASGYHLYQGAPGADPRHRASGPQSSDRFQRPDLARPRRFLRHRRLWDGDPDHEIRSAVLGGIPLASVVCFVAGFLFGFPALRFGGLYLALATFALASRPRRCSIYKGFDAYTGGAMGLQLVEA